MEDTQVDYKELKKYYRTELLTGGLVLGLVLVGILFLQSLTQGESMGFLRALLQAADVVAIVTVLVVYGRRVSINYAGQMPKIGFSYGRAFGFSLLLVMLSGVIYGTGYYLLTEVIDPATYAGVKQGLIAGMMDTYRAIPGFTEEQIEMSGRMLSFMLHNLLGIVIVYVLQMVFQGGFVALFTSAIIRKKPTL